MRPTGEIRQALKAALQAGSGTTRDLAARAGVGMQQAKVTICRMKSELSIVGYQQVQGVRQRVPVYSLECPAAEQRVDASATYAAIAAAFRHGPVSSWGEL